MACTIACDQGHITAHKSILCNHSKYLEDILSDYPNAEHPIIILTELNITDIKVLIFYMYTGELILTEDSSPTSLLRAAQILKIDSLTAENINDNLEVHDDDDDDVDDGVDDHLDDDDDDVDDGIDGETSSSLHEPMDDESESELENRHLIINNSNNDSIELQKHIPLQLPTMITKQAIKSQSLQLINNNNSNNINKQPQSQLPTQFQPQSPLDQQQSQHSQSQSKIRCHLCNIGLSDVKCLYRHVLTRHLPEKWGYKCEFCDREFSRDDHLMRHYTTKHKNMEFDREKIRETRRLNREMAKNFHDQISTV